MTLFTSLFFSFSKKWTKTGKEWTWESIIIHREGREWERDDIVNGCYDQMWQLLVTTGTKVKREWMCHEKRTEREREKIFERKVGLFTPTFDMVPLRKPHSIHGHSNQSRLSILFLSTHSSISLLTLSLSLSLEFETILSFLWINIHNWNVVPTKTLTSDLFSLINYHSSKSFFLSSPPVTLL